MRKNVMFCLRLFFSSQTLNYCHEVNFCMYVIIWYHGQPRLSFCYNSLRWFAVHYRNVKNNYLTGSIIRHNNDYSIMDEIWIIIYSRIGSIEWRVYISQHLEVGGQFQLLSDNIRMRQTCKEGLHIHIETRNENRSIKLSILSLASAFPLHWWYFLHGVPSDNDIGEETRVQNFVNLIIVLLKCLFELEASPRRTSVRRMNHRYLIDNRASSLAPYHAIISARNRATLSGSAAGRRPDAGRVEDSDTPHSTLRSPRAQSTHVFLCRSFFFEPLFFLLELSFYSYSRWEGHFSSSDWWYRCRMAASFVTYFLLRWAKSSEAFIKEERNLQFASRHVKSIQKSSVYIFGQFISHNYFVQFIRV